jgi:cyclophilin family peptidyl-prolyl cis-trans isomerase
MKWVFIGLTVCIVVGGIVFMEATTKNPVPLEKGQMNTTVVEQIGASESATPIVSETQTEPAVKGETMKQKTYATQPAMGIDSKKSYTATMTTSAGIMKLKLFASETPITVNNFVFLAREGFYTNTVFHRILSGFMIQGGDPTGTGMGSPGYKFNDEPVTRNYTRGTIAMANSGANTNGSQFFIMHTDYPLPKQYVIFGAIDPSDTESFKTLDALASTPVGESGQGERSKPMTPPVVTSVTIEEK